MAPNEELKAKQDELLARLLELDDERKAARERHWELARQRNDLMLECRANGITGEDIARLLGVSPRWVYETMRKAMPHTDATRRDQIDWLRRHNKQWKRGLYGNND